MTKFPIPSSLQDLEREPYDLLPYPSGFVDDNEATRADSFEQLVLFLEQGNRTLINSGIDLFDNVNSEDEEEWNCEDRIQALYTLVRKSASLSNSTRKRLVNVLCKALCRMSSILASTANSSKTPSSVESENSNLPLNVYVVPQMFRDALACHLYMLYTIMIFMESEIKAGKTVISTGGQGKSKDHGDGQSVQKLREECASTMLTVTRTMAVHKTNLWKRGVPDENVISLPCRVAYQMLDNSMNMTARKLSSGDLALEIIATSLESNQCLMNTVVSALLDMMHSLEHMAPVAAELCCMMETNPENSRGNQLAIELLREIGRLDGSTTSGSDTSGKASGIKNVAPFVSEIAEKKPQLVIENISLVLSHLHSEPYNLRSAIISAIGYLLVHLKAIHVMDNTDDIVTDNQHHPRGSELTHSKRLCEMKEKLYDILLEHVYDVSSYTRATVMKTWATIIEAQALPTNKLILITELAIDRLQDKTVMVRRSAMQVLTLVLENNPFTESLNPSPYEKKMEEVKRYLIDNLPLSLKEAFLQSTNGLDETNPSERSELEDATIKALIDDLESSSSGTSDDSSGAEEHSELFKKIKVFQFLQSAIDFIKIFESANDAFQSMLLSSNKSDVTEALRFFVRARHFQLPCAVTGIKQSLSLMWSNEKSIQDEVLTAFIDVFICETNGKAKLPSKQIVDNLIKLVGTSNASELACIEEAISRLVKEEIIPSEVFLILWSIAAKASGKPRSIAMTILSMGATADSGIVDSASRLRHLLQAGLGEYTEEQRDWATAKSAAYALQRVSRVKPDPSSAKFLVLEQIVERLSIVIQGQWCDDSREEDTCAWFGAAEEAINAIFAICPAPEQVARLVIMGMISSTFDYGTGVSSTNHFCHSLRLSRFFFVIGHISLKLLVYSEALSGEVRSANAARTIAKQEQADKAKSGKSLDPDVDDGSDIETELGLAQAAEADTENMVADIADKEIIGRGLIDLFTPLVVRVVADDSSRFYSQILMQSSVLTLCKFMCISRSFCESHMPLLFTAIEKAPKRDITLRANTVIALGDLAFRFPNEVEPYTSKIYSGLRDDSMRVRLHTLMVLTHLILNDMVKVKGQVCEIALCLRDSEVRIRDMARLLFHELSKRSNNPIYNLLPEIISRLSNTPMKKDDFRAIMSFLLNFINKERQAEMIVEKLCHRFPKCSTITQRANISYCLTHVKSNEKCIKILCENFNLYKDSLFDEDVMRNFMTIVTKSKKQAKPEMKQYLEEWEEKLKQHSEMGLEDVEADKKAEREKLRAAKRSARIKNQTQKANDSDNPDDECLSLDGEIMNKEQEMECSDKSQVTTDNAKRQSSRRRILSAIN